MGVFGYLAKLVESGSGVSSKAFFLVAVTVIGCLLLVVVGFALVWEVVHSGTIQTDLSGLAAFVGAIAGLFATAGATKAWGERGERGGGSAGDKNVGSKPDGEKE